MSSPHCSKETSSRLNKSNQDTFKEKADAGIIDINNTTPAYIESIQVKFWGSKRPDTFGNNFRTELLNFEPSERLPVNEQVSLCVFACAGHFH